MVHSSALVAEILGKSRIDPTGLKIFGLLIESLKYLETLLDEASLIQRIAVHNCHMGKHRTVFLVSVGETKGTPHIGLHLTKIRVQLISSDLLVEKQLICGEDDLLNLLLVAVPDIIGNTWLVRVILVPPWNSPSSLRLLLS